MSETNNKGNWEFNFFQKKFEPEHEAKLKIAMKFDNGFNPKDVHKYITHYESKEEIILSKQNNGISLKTYEQLILNNYLKKNRELYENDIKMIKQYGLGYKPVSTLGKTKLLLETLKYQIQKNNKDLVVNIYLRLMEDSFCITPELKLEYSVYLNKMETIINEVDIIELQFTKFYSQMPPLNVNGFKKFDDWQISVINNIDNNISTIVNAPTSAGKSVLAGYTTTKGRIIYIVPTDALAWQISSYLTNIIGTNVPILTLTYQTSPHRYDMIDILNKSSAIVGTADIILDYLPFLKLDFKWLILDEVHMIGKESGHMMEPIIKLLNNISVLALSATISNLDDIVVWFNKILINPIQKIVCNKRFFNLQKYYYDDNQIKVIHPLSMINAEEIKDGSISNKLLLPTPPDIWDLAMKLNNLFDLNELKPHIYFDKNKRIELNDANEYFDKLLLFMKNKDIDNIINEYKHDNDISCDINIIDLAFKLKNENKTPVIIFQANTLSCLNTVRQFAKDIEDLELKTHPKLFNDRLKLIKQMKRLDKKTVVEDVKHDKKSNKLMMESKELDTDMTFPSLQEPHNDFIFNHSSYFNEATIETWLIKLKKYFPNTGHFYHYMIKLLWRGVGVYTQGLPDPYLRLVQSLACNKQLAIVFSDKSLVFGISMPFRTVVILNNNNDIDTMLYHQMIGRAGRRGQDKEGHIIFAGFKWDKIKELSQSAVPEVYGGNNILYNIIYANTLSSLHNTLQKWENSSKNYLNNNIDEDDINEQINNIESNFENSLKFALNKTDINHLYMNWKFKDHNESLLISYLLPYMKRAFEYKDHTVEINQINIAHFLCRFISISPTDTDILESPSILLEAPYNIILSELEDLQIDIPSNIDNKLYLSISKNLLIECYDELLTDILRDRLMEFGEKVKNIQHYCYHSSYVGLTKLLGKLLTRIWWIYHLSSPIMKK